MHCYEIDGRRGLAPTFVLLGELNSANNNNSILPIYTHFHRALLFKVLADQISLPSALIRGEDSRAYNVVYFLGVGMHAVDDDDARPQCIQQQ